MMLIHKPIIMRPTLVGKPFHHALNWRFEIKTANVRFDRRRSLIKINPILLKAIFSRFLYPNQTLGWSWCTAKQVLLGLNLVLTIPAKSEKFCQSEIQLTVMNDGCWRLLLPFSHDDGGKQHRNGCTRSRDLRSHQQHPEGWRCYYPLSLTVGCCAVWVLHIREDHTAAQSVSRSVMVNCVRKCTWGNNGRWRWRQLIVVKDEENNRWKKVA